ncbi:Zn-ribbon domain-containing OB-fold protein [Nocardia tengchongensis]|uniref:Zn-ribbon domain-containing OB-fold protein n=1 Tax=Nocardia tengchongensis TaxID=2055889 RepID=UPI0036933CDA
MTDVVEAPDFEDVAGRARLWLADADGSPKPIGWQCNSCGRVRLPSRHLICRRCTSESAAPIELTGTATIYSRTVVHRGFPGTPVPYTVVVVDLSEGIRLRTVLVGDGADRAEIGDVVRLVPMPGAQGLDQAGFAVSPHPAHEEVTP